MYATREEQKAEAVERMKRWCIVADAIKQFEKKDTVMYSDRGLLYWLTKDQKQAVKEFEEEYGGLVYMVIHNFTEFGEMLSLLYVGKDKTHWEEDREDIKQGCAFAYVKNLDDDLCSECGMIGVANRYGGLVRTS